MEETISFISHIFGAIIFCIAISLLFFYGTLEQNSIKSLEEQVIATSVYQR